MNKTALIALTLALSGCASYDYDAHKQREVERLSEEARQRDNNPTRHAYEQGTKHGCDSGANASGSITKRFHKDIDKYVQDAYYKSGWDDGFAKCKAEGDRVNQIINDSM